MPADRLTSVCFCFFFSAAIVRYFLRCLGSISDAARMSFIARSNSVADLVAIKT